MKKKNIFTAHEIAQMKVLTQKNDIYQKFLEKNFWGSKFLANWWQMHAVFPGQESLFENVSEESLAEKVILKFFQLLEPLSRFIQIHYLVPHRTREIIKDGVLMFHPRDASRSVLTKYRRIVKI